MLFFSFFNHESLNWNNFFTPVLLWFRKVLYNNILSTTTSHGTLRYLSYFKINIVVKCWWKGVFERNIYMVVIFYKNTDLPSTGEYSVVYPRGRTTHNVVLHRLEILGCHLSTNFVPVFYLWLWFQGTKLLISSCLAISWHKQLDLPSHQCCLTFVWFQGSQLLMAVA